MLLMTEQKPVYTLEFVLNYDHGGNSEKSFKFSGSSEDPWVTWLASLTIQKLNNSLISNRLYDRSLVSVEIYKNGQAIDQKDLGEEILRYHESKKQKSKQ